MEFTVSRADLVRELNLSQGVVEKKTTIPILSNVLLEADGDRILLTATDLELGIRCSCPARVKKTGGGTIPARRLLDYVRLLPDADVQVKIQENHWASLVCGRSKTRIAGMSRDSFPELPEMPAVSSGELPGISGSYRALLPRKAMGELQKLASDSDPAAIVRFSGDENHLFFQLGDRLLLSRKLTGNFPDYERVLPKEHPYSVALNRQELHGAIERVAQFSDERSRAIRVRFGDGEVKVYSSVSETGDSEESIPAAYENQAVEVGFNAQYLLDFLRAVQGEQVTFLFKDPHSAGELRPGGEKAENYRYVIMPMRI